MEGGFSIVFLKVFFIKFSIDDNFLLAVLWVSETYVFSKWAIKIDPPQAATAWLLNGHDNPAALADKSETEISFGEHNVHY